MINGIGPLEASHVTDALAGSKLDHFEQLARRGELLHASQEFESYFVSYMLKVMRETVPQGELTANKMGKCSTHFMMKKLANELLSLVA